MAPSGMAHQTNKAAAGDDGEITRGGEARRAGVLAYGWRIAICLEKRGAAPLVKP